MVFERGGSVRWGASSIRLSKRGCDFLQPTQELAISQALQHRSCLFEWGRITGHLGEDDPHTGGMGNQAVLLSIIDCLSQPDSVLIGQGLGNLKAA